MLVIGRTGLKEFISLSWVVSSVLFSFVCEWKDSSYLAKFGIGPFYFTYRKALFGFWLRRELTGTWIYGIP